MRSKLTTLIFSFLAVLIAPVAAMAGGPLLVDPATGQPYKWGPGVVRVYTDLGPLGKLSNEGAGLRVAFTCQQWTDVPTSSFEAQVVGDFASVGLPDINSTNAKTVIGKYNGGGIHVLYDTDGKILKDVLGVPSNVLGVATPEWTETEDSDVVTESWVVLNGSVVNTQAQADNMRGVITHEFGHSIGLAHSQTNGAIVD